MLETTITKTYIRKPLTVEAVQATADNFEEVARWCFGTILNTTDHSKAKALDPANQFISVRVNNPKTDRQSQAFVGDWILYTDRGYKVYTTKAFESNFNLV